MDDTQIRELGAKINVAYPQLDAFMSEVLARAQLDGTLQTLDFSAPIEYPELPVGGTLEITSPVPTIDHGAAATSAVEDAVP